MRECPPVGPRVPVRRRGRNGRGTLAGRGSPASKYLGSQGDWLGGCGRNDVAEREEGWNMKVNEKPVFPCFVVEVARRVPSSPGTSSWWRSHSWILPRTPKRHCCLCGTFHGLVQLVYSAFWVLGRSGMGPFTVMTKSITEIILRAPISEAHCGK